MEIGVILSLSTPMWERVLVRTGRYWEVLVGTGASGRIVHAVGRVRETKSGMQDPNKDVWYMAWGCRPAVTGAGQDR